MFNRFLTYEFMKVLVDMGYEDVKIVQGKMIAKYGDFVFIDLKMNNKGLITYDTLERIIPDFSNI